MRESTVVAVCELYFVDAKFACLHWRGHPPSSGRIVVLRLDRSIVPLNIVRELPLHPTRFSSAAPSTCRAGSRRWSNTLAASRSATHKTAVHALWRIDSCLIAHSVHFHGGTPLLLGEKLHGLAKMRWKGDMNILIRLCGSKPRLWRRRCGIRCQSIGPVRSATMEGTLIF